MFCVCDLFGGYGFGVFIVLFVRVGWLLVFVDLNLVVCVYVLMDCIVLYCLCLVLGCCSV